MPQNKEAQAFLSRVAALPAGPGVSLDGVLKHSIDDEAKLRRYFASDRGNTRPADPYVGLVDVFHAPVNIRETRARIVKDEADQGAAYVMPLKESDRKKEGTPTMVADIEEFKKNWAVFTEGSLSQLIDWNNVVAAGGSVLACVTPLADKNKASKRAIRKYYHTASYPTSDVDLFLWGMTPAQAEVKINTIYEAVRDSIPWDVTCIRTKHTVSIHSQYPYRAVQIVLRLYQSPAEILAGFDVDAPCFAYDGTKVWGNPRAIVAMMRQANTVDMSRRSPSYEVRLAKYASRGFEVYVPDLVREKIDPTIFERSIAKMEGLARLLVFEKLKDGDARYAFLESRRQLRGRPNPLARYRRDKRKYKGDLKEDTGIGGLEMNDYDVASLHIPYGPGWDARRIDKLVYQTDLGMNSTFNPKNKGRRLHRHPAFFGTMQECLEDCCETCAEPIDEDERELFKTESEKYITGRIKFIEEDPGRQSITGSFNPIDVGEWSEQVYVKQADQFFTDISTNNIEAVKAHLKSENLDLNNRDHVGRTALHVAIISNAPEVACELIEAGVRISARLADGRSALHMAARYDQVGVLKKLLERNAVNKEMAGVVDKEDDEAMDEDKKSVPDRPSSEDDWSSDDNDGKGLDVDMADVEDDCDDEDDEGDEEDEDDDDSEKGPSTTAPPASTAGDLPEDNEDEPDVFEVDGTDWDFGFTALSYAVLFASPAMVEALVEGGADVTQVTTTNHHGAQQLHPLAITILRKDEDEACAIAEQLITKGASSSTADSYLMTVFHKMVRARKAKLAGTILKVDPNASTIINFPMVRYGDVFFPIVTAISNKDYSTLALLLAHGARLEFSQEDLTRAQEAAEPNSRGNLFGYGVTNPLNQCFTPLETALAKHDDIAQLLLSFNVAFNLPIKQAVLSYASPLHRATIKDWVDWAVKYVEFQISKLDTVVLPKNVETEPEPEFSRWKRHLANFEKSKGENKSQYSKDAEQRKTHDAAKLLQTWKATQDYLSDLQRLLGARSAKSWKELLPQLEHMPWPVPGVPAVEWGADDVRNRSRYLYISSKYGSLSVVPAHLNEPYDELFEACFTGDSENIEKLCVLPKDGPAEPVAKPLLNISVMVRDGESNCSRTGLTTLYAACEGRHWETAKLIVAIATSQYAPPDKDEAKIRFSVSNIKLDDDDDDEYDSDCSGDSDDTVHQEKEQAKFVDIAKISSVVRSATHPGHMISEVNLSWRHDGKSQHGNLLSKTVVQKDLEGFMQIVGLYQSLSEPIALNAQLLYEIIAVDSPEILHEYIRHSGFGLDFKEAKKANQDLPEFINDSNRTYLGLNVHGKKRSDLARKNDPDAYEHSSDVAPLVRLAARINGCDKVIDYLASDKPLAAFRYHATHGKTPRAQQLRCTSNLEKVLPTWLGWTINHLGESPLTSAIMGNSLESIKLLFSKRPALLKSVLHEKIKFCGHNTFMLAVVNNAKTKILDFLLAKSVSPAEQDHYKGWNVYHWVCNNNNLTLLEYLLKKLPKDVTEVLLSQQSKVRLNMPLHVAAHSGASKLVETVLKFNPEFAVARNVDGQTPLHLACQQGFPNTAKSLLTLGSQHGGLFLENGIGQTPYEAIWLKDLIQLLESDHHSYPSPSTLSGHSMQAEPERIDINHLEKEIPRLQETVDRLVAEKRPANPSDFEFKFKTFINFLENRLSLAREAKDRLPPLPVTETPVSDFGPKDNRDISRTWEVVAEKWEAVRSGQHRDLIKLVDVQASVKANLDKAGEERKKNNVDSDDEEDEETQIKNNVLRSYLESNYTEPDSI